MLSSCRAPRFSEDGISPGTVWPSSQPRQDQRNVNGPSLLFLPPLPHSIGRSPLFRGVRTQRTTAQQHMCICSMDLRSENENGGAGASGARGEPSTGPKPVHRRNSIPVVPCRARCWFLLLWMFTMVRVLAVRSGCPQCQQQQERAPMIQVTK